MKSSIKRRPIRVATVSHRPQHGTDTPENTQRLLGVTSNMIERAARLGADLVAFPEIYPQLAIHDAFITPSHPRAARSTAFANSPAAIASTSSGPGSSATPIAACATRRSLSIARARSWDVTTRCFRRSASWKRA